MVSPTPCFQTSRFQNCKTMNFCCFKPLGLYYFARKYGIPRKLIHCTSKYNHNVSICVTVTKSQSHCYQISCLQHLSSVFIFSNSSICSLYSSYCNIGRSPHSILTAYYIQTHSHRPKPTQIQTHAHEYRISVILSHGQGTDSKLLNTAISRKFLHSTIQSYTQISSISVSTQH